MSAAASTRKRLLREKSTSLPIIDCLSLLHRILEHQRSLHYLIAGLQTGDHLLQIVGKHASRNDFLTPEAAASERGVDPFAIVQVQNRGGGDGGVLFHSLTVERRRDEHSQPHKPRIFHLQTNLR